MELQNFTFKRVMIIDDTQIDRYLAAFVMKKNNFAGEIMEFDMAVKALDFLRAHQHLPEKFPEIILLDIRMPYMDGFEFLEQLSLMPQYIANSCCIIMLSSSLSPSDHQRADDNPVVKKFLNKPLNKDNLSEIKELYVNSRVNENTMPIGAGNNDNSEK
jgi:CheY-like chemotaxis protein